ncbi:hypothetical protein B0H12DRAFT_1074338 [Mycena haematopus]|nr:hypothetical protein B0H12DRAFT_1074338 [Mycena haematopus]
MAISGVTPTCAYVSSIASLTTSTVGCQSLCTPRPLTRSQVNIGLLTILHGHEFGWFCLASCGIDVVFNAAALFWVTSRSTLNNTTSSAIEHETTLHSSPPPSEQRSQLKSFHLRQKSVAPKPFEIHVTTSSLVDTSPPFPRTEVPLEVPFEEKAWRTGRPRLNDRWTMGRRMRDLKRQTQSPTVFQYAHKC